MATIAPAFTANGLASGLDDDAIIQSLVAIQEQPIAQLQGQQAAIQTQISDLGSISSDLQALQSAADGLATGGVVATGISSTNTAFTATAGTQAAAGQYQVQVTALAMAAKARSAAFSSSGAAVTGGTLNLTVQGQSYSLDITDGETLSSVAQAINQLGAPVTATIISDGTQSYLELNNQQTGYPVGSAQSSALSVSETTTGTQGTALGLSVIQPATNSALTVDGLPITETTNSISDVIPGVTINLSSTESAPETLVLSTNTSDTAQNLQAFVSAYNTLNAALQAQLNPPTTTNASGAVGAQPAPLSGDAAVMGLEQQLQQILTTTVAGVSGFNSLASIGITSDDQTGAISINQSLLTNALNTNPQAVNALFAQATTGVSAAIDQLTSSYADPATGAITQETQNLNSQIQTLSQKTTQMQQNLVDYQQTLQSQFAAMEQIESTSKSVGNYLNALSDVQVADGVNAT